MTISGYANHGEKAQDIVCTGVSALFLTLQESLLNQIQDKVLYSDHDVMVIGESEEAELLFASFTGGMEMTADKYPKNGMFQRAEPEEKTMMQTGSCIHQRIWIS